MRFWGSDMPTRRSISTARDSASCLLRLVCSMMASHSWLPMVNVGFSEVIGSWKIMLMRSPRILRISSSVLPTSSSPLNRMLPETMRPGWVSICMME